ncbi:hypothetical protein F4818DRAFT_442603 [Hypoxylon cercidicola]|nr:hypothetical protein F4818DRAFT_442603 [Hypoxylon cercidicola]
MPLLSTRTSYLKPGFFMVHDLAVLESRSSNNKGSGFQVCHIFFGKLSGKSRFRDSRRIVPRLNTPPELLPPTRIGEPGKTRPTAYLYGLRDFAALLVRWHHHQLWAHLATHQSEIFEDAFGYDKYYLTTFHDIQTFVSDGHYPVSTFFVISGYLLSAKPLSLIQAQEYVKLVAVSFLYMTSWYAFGLWVVNANPKGTRRDELQSWYFELKNFSFTYNLGEFKGSIVIYICLLAFSRLAKNARLAANLF